MLRALPFARCVDVPAKIMPDSVRFLVFLLPHMAAMSAHLGVLYNVNACLRAVDAKHCDTQDHPKNCNTYYTTRLDDILLYICYMYKHIWRYSDSVTTIRFRANPKLTND